MRFHKSRPTKTQFLHRLQIIDLYLEKIKRKMKHLMKGIRIAAYIAEIIVAGSTIVELVEKYSGRSKRKSAASKVDTGNVATENP